MSLVLRKGEQKRFMIDFAETLYHKNRAALHLVLDESDEWAPQRAIGDEARLLGAIEDLVRRGRARGIGVTMITQRPAVLNKNVLTQIEVLIALRLTSPQDRQALNEWVKYHADTDSSSEMITSLPTLPIGTAWFWSPGWLDIFKKVAIRPRETLDSSSTPKVGQSAIQATKRAPVDIAELKAQLAATIEKVEGEDPRLLRRRITELERQLQAKKPVIQTIEVPVISDEQLGHLLQMGANLVQFGNNLIEALKAHTPVHHYEPMKNEDIKTIPPKGHFKEIQQKVKEGTISDRAASFAAAIDYGRNDVSLSAAERKILTVLAQYPSGRTRRQLGILSGYSVKSGHFTNTLSKLRQTQYIEGMGDDLRITKSGIEAIGDFEPVPTGQRLVGYWLQRLGKAPSTILSAALEAYPNSLSYDDLAERTGYSKSSGHFTNTLSKLRGLQLVSGTGSVRAADVFFEEEARS